MSFVCLVTANGILCILAKLINYQLPYEVDSATYSAKIKFSSLISLQAFIQFVTGCGSLPLGGVTNFHPRLTVIRKEAHTPNVYPSVNTCVHYLKLPEYPSEEVLKHWLLDATREKGFHLN